MENTDKIKDMITLIERNNEQYHEALNNLADTFDKSISDNLRRAITLELARNESMVTGGKQKNGLMNPVTRMSRLFSRKA